MEQTKTKTAEELLHELGGNSKDNVYDKKLWQQFQSHIANLEQQVSDLETALIITKNSRKAHIERYANIDVEKNHLEAQNKELREALKKIKTACEYMDLHNTRPHDLAEQALKEDKQDG